MRALFQQKSLAFLGSQTLNAEPKLTCNRDRKLHLRVAELMCALIVRHELSNEPTFSRQWDESQSLNSLTLDRRLQAWLKVGRLDVFHHDRFGVFGIALPRGVSLDSSPIAIGQTAPGGEFHHARVIEHENGRAFATQRPHNCIERGIVDVFS